MTPAGAFGGTVNCSNNSGDASAVQAALNSAPSGSTVTITGTCSIGSNSIAVPSRNLTLTGGAIFSGNGGANGNYNIALGSNTTLRGLIFDNVIAGTPGTSDSVTTNLTITGCTFRNLTNAGGGNAIQFNPVLTNSSITNNTFSNLWPNGYSSTTSFPGDDNTTVNMSGISTSNGIDNTTISNNTFDEIYKNGISIGFNQMFANTNRYPTAHNVVISNNTFTRLHRYPIEMQGSPDAACLGGCYWYAVPVDGLLVSGNYSHNSAWPYWNQWISIPMNNATNSKYLNNAWILDNTAQPCAGFLVPYYEVASKTVTFQGNLGASLAGSGCTARGTYIAVGGTTGDTDTFQNNILCGPSSTTNIAPEVSNPPTIVDQYNYKSASSCPAGSTLASSSITTAFISANNQSFPSGGNGTWTSFVISNLPIRQVQFLIDGSGTPVVSQQIQDVNTNFANDRKWLYHATLNTSSLGGGNHTITASVTDVSGATQSATQNFVVGSGSSGTPKAQVTPASLSFGSQTSGLTSSPQTATLSNSGTAALTISSISVGGANAADFTQTNTCGSSLALGASCTMSVTFTPSASGPRVAALSINDDDPGLLQTVNLAGTGVNPSLPPPTSPPASPPSLPTNLPTGMILWLANNAGVVANGSEVSAWDDQSGSGTNAVQPNTANRPTLVPGANGQSALRFDGSSSFLSIPNIPINGYPGLAVFLVSANSTDLPGGYGQYAFLYWPETVGWGSSFFGSYQTSAHFRFGTTQTGNEPSYRMPFTRTNSFGLGEWMHSGSTDSMWFNGQSTASYSGELQSLNGVGSVALLGQGINNTFYAGDVSEIIVYSRGLNTSERQVVEQYLMSKYHL